MVNLAVEEGIGANCKENGKKKGKNVMGKKGRL